MSTPNLDQFFRHITIARLEAELYHAYRIETNTGPDPLSKHRRNIMSRLELLPSVKAVQGDAP